MGSVPFALSVSHFISSVGADAGFASIVGLAVLVLLYFAQARETASLREQAEQASAHVQQLETRIAQLTQLGRQPPAPVPAAPPPSPRPLGNPAAAASPGVVPAAVSAAGVAAGARAGDGAAPAPPAPAPPAGVGAPALTAATRLIPASGGQSAASIPHSVIRGPAVPTAPSTPAASSTAVAPGPGTPAAGANGAGAPPRAPAPAPYRNPTSPPRTAHGAGARWLTLGAFALGAVAVIVALVILTSGGATKTHLGAPTPTTNAPVSHITKPKPFNYASVTIAVLNGTPTSGLAGRVANKLVGTGYKKGTVATASDQTRTATVVAYTPGHRADALAVAATLKLGPASVQPVDQTTQAVACPPPGACTATVVVTVGADLTTI